MVINKKGEKILDKDDYLTKHLLSQNSQESNSEILDKINNDTRYLAQLNAKKINDCVKKSNPQNNFVTVTDVDDCLAPYFVNPENQKYIHNPKDGVTSLIEEITEDLKEKKVQPQISILSISPLYNQDSYSKIRDKLNKINQNKDVEQLDYKYINGYDAKEQNGYSIVGYLMVHNKNNKEYKAFLALDLLIKNDNGKNNDIMIFDNDYEYCKMIDVFDKLKKIDYEEIKEKIEPLQKNREGLIKVISSYTKDIGITEDALNGFLGKEDSYEENKNISTLILRYIEAAKKINNIDFICARSKSGYQIIEDNKLDDNIINMGHEDAIWGLYRYNQEITGSSDFDEILKEYQILKEKDKALERLIKIEISFMLKQNKTIDKDFIIKKIKPDAKKIIKSDNIMEYLSQIFDSISIEKIQSRQSQSSNVQRFIENGVSKGKIEPWSL